MSYRPKLLPADLAALAVGVKPATLRDWRRRGLLTPAAGTARKPLYRVADLEDAKNAPKPKRANAA